MKCLLTLFFFALCTSSFAHVWKTLPEGVRIVGYRNVTTSKVSSNFNQFRSESPLVPEFRVDARTLDAMMGGMIKDIFNNQDAYNKFLVGAYKIDVGAQFNVHGTGFGYGLTDKVMFYTEIAYYNAQINADIKRTKGNTYEETARKLEAESNGPLSAAAAELTRKMIDGDLPTLQSVITNHYKYKPLGDWSGSGYGDMETGLMLKLVDRGFWGLLFYPGVILPTGKEDDPDILQDVGFGDGQFDLFSEVATGYVVNDSLSFGTTLRYTYQASSQKTLRIPESREYPISSNKGRFDVKYGDKINWMLNTTYTVNDWISFTPMYRFMYQAPSKYFSEYSEANEFLSYQSDKQEHQVQFTTTISSISPFLKKKFVLPAQININLVQTLAGKNVPKVGRFEMEFRMLF